MDIVPRQYIYYIIIILKSNSSEPDTLFGLSHLIFSATL